MQKSFEQIERPPLPRKLWASCSHVKTILMQRQEWSKPCGLTGKLPTKTIRSFRLDTDPCNAKTHANKLGSTRLQLMQGPCKADKSIHFRAPHPTKTTRGHAKATKSIMTICKQKDGKDTLSARQTAWTTLDWNSCKGSLSYKPYASAKVTCKENSRSCNKTMQSKDKELMQTPMKENQAQAIKTLMQRVQRTKGKPRATRRTLQMNLFFLFSLGLF